MSRVLFNLSGFAWSRVEEVIAALDADVFALYEGLPFRDSALGELLVRDQEIVFEVAESG